MLDVVQHPLVANFAASLLACAISFYFYIRKQERFKNHPYTLWAFHMWTAQWGTLLTLYLALAVILGWGYTELPQGALVILLCFVELTTVCALGLLCFLLQGDGFDVKGVGGWLGVLLFFLVLWDIGCGLLLVDNVVSRETWVLPSQIFSMLGLIGMAIALILRYGPPALAFFVFSFAYSAVQLPVYDATFVSRQEVPGLFQILAIGKLTLLAGFYSAFLTGEKRHDPIRFIGWLVNSFSQLNRVLAWLVVLVLGVLGTVVAEILRRWLLKLIYELGLLPSG